MQLKNFSIILAFLSLKVISSPIASEGEVSAVEISDVEVSADEVVNVNDNTILGVDDGSDSELDTSEFSRTDFDTFINWIESGNMIDELNMYEQNAPVYSKEVFETVRANYNNGEHIKPLQQQYEAINYGIKVDVNGHKMSVNIKGEGNDKTIVLLPAQGMIDTVHFYRNVTDSLSTDYRMVTIEPFGYGLSDIVEEERTAENIVNEIHICLQKLGINKFYLMGHSIGGIYSLHYDEKYPEEVLGFIGIDNTPNNLQLTSPEFSDEYINYIKKANKYHIHKLFPEEVKSVITPLSYELMYQNYSEKELEEIEIIYNYRNNNINVINETKFIAESIMAVNGKNFTCPMLMFTSEESEIGSRETYNIDWIKSHEEMAQSFEGSMVIPMNGTHLFLYTENKDEMTRTIKEWIN